MGKSVFIAEKPSVAAEFAKALKLNTSRRDGYMESENAIVTWCVGHLVTMSYPEVYDEKYKKEKKKRKKKGKGRGEGDTARKEKIGGARRKRRVKKV